jgi:hypothetical protein
VPSEGLPGGSPLQVLSDLLPGLVHYRDVLTGVPADRAAALLAADAHPTVTPHSASVASASLETRLPTHVNAMRMGGRLIPLPPGLQLIEAVPDGLAVLLRFSDGARLWLHQPRVAVDPAGLTALVAGALLWPTPDWPLPQATAAWAITQGPDGVRHILLGTDAKPVGLTGLAEDPEDFSGVALDLQ